MGQSVDCVECHKQLAGELDTDTYVRHREGIYCWVCKNAYCLSHCKVGSWTRFVVTMDDKVRVVVCPNGHEIVEQGCGL